MESETIRYVIDTYKARIADVRGIADEAQEELRELERLAKIGEATEKAFKQYPQSHFAIGKDYNLETEVGGVIYNTEDLVKWSEGVEE